MILFKILRLLDFAHLFLVACTSVSKAKGMNGDLSNTLDQFSIYPLDVIDYAVSGSSLIEFNLNFNGEVKNLHLIKSLGIPFDNSTMDGLSHYVSKKIISARNNFNNQYRLEIKFEN